MVIDMVKEHATTISPKEFGMFMTTLTVWVDASSLALEVIVEVDGMIIEDAYWFRKDDTTHVYMSKLDAVKNGLNMGLNRKMSILHICTDLKAVFHCVTDALTRKSRLNTKASNEMLIRRRLQTDMKIVDEYKHSLDIKLVPSESSLADALTQGPGSLLKMVDKSPKLFSSGTISASLSSKERNNVHRSTRHYGVKRIFYFFLRIDPSK